MLEYSHGEIGWDVFTLEYKVDAPINTVLDPESMMKYLKLFNHLWQMKRIERVLSQGWMRIAGGARTFLRVPGKYSKLRSKSNISFTPRNPRSPAPVASNPYCHGRNGSLYPSNASILSIGSD
jgi:hypothetical protein